MSWNSSSIASFNCPIPECPPHPTCSKNIFNKLDLQASNKNDPKKGKLIRLKEEILNQLIVCFPIIYKTWTNPRWLFGISEPLNHQQFFILQSHQQSWVLRFLPFNQPQNQLFFEGTEKWNQTFMTFGFQLCIKDDFKMVPWLLAQLQYFTNLDFAEIARWFPRNPQLPFGGGFSGTPWNPMVTVRSVHPAIWVPASSKGLP